MLDNREAANLIVLASFLVGGWFVFRSKDETDTFTDVLASAVTPAVVVPSLMLIGYVTGAVAIGARIGIWEPTLLYGTLEWFATVALVAMFELTGRDAPSVRRFVGRAFGISAVLEFASGVYVFGLLPEIVVKVFILLTAVVVAVAGSGERHPRLHRVGQAVLATTGVALVAYSVGQALSNRSSLQLSELAQDAALPAWLTLALAPLLYVWTLYLAYDTALRRLWYRASTPPALPLRSRLRAALALAITFRGRRSSLYRLDMYVARQVVEAPTLKEAVAAAEEQIAEERRQAAAELRAEKRLRDNAGLRGVDEGGKQLDQREFAETKKALKWLHTCHMGHYRQRGFYRDDLLGIVAESRRFHALPNGAHGLRMSISPDGQRWWAWRETVTGWVLGIGADGPPPDERFYDSPEPPRTGPLPTATDWAGSFEFESTPNW